jgi:hypothetical protein
MDLNPARHKPSRKPETIPAGLEGYDNPANLAAPFYPFVPPAIDQPQQRPCISVKLLQWLLLEAWYEASNQPFLQTQFNNSHKRAILIKGDEGSA